MKQLNFYNNEFEAKDEKSVFIIFLDNLKPSNMLPSYFVNWSKVIKNVNDIEMDLNTLNYLIGKKNFDSAFRSLLKKNPNVVKILPALAVRAGTGLMKFDVLVNYKDGNLTFKKYDFSEYNPKHTDQYIEFLEITGVKKILQDKRVKNLVDYMIGMEAGLDSNARKNRAGTAMENIVEVFINDFCERKGYRYEKEANADKIKEKFGYIVPVDKQKRRYDFVVDTGKKPIIFEVNFYNSQGGSKLKATAGEYIGLHNILKKEKIPFVWITDGPGWLSVQAGLEEAFHAIDYVFNLYSLEKGILFEEF